MLHRVIWTTGAAILGVLIAGFGLLYMTGCAYLMPEDIDELLVEQPIHATLL